MFSIYFIQTVKLNQTFSTIKAYKYSVYGLAASPTTHIVCLDNPNKEDETNILVYGKTRCYLSLF